MRLPSTSRTEGTRAAFSPFSEATGAIAARRPPADHTLHRAERLDLHPRRRSGPRLIDRIEALRNDPFDPLLACGFEERDARAWETLAAADRAHRGQRFVEPPQALAKRLSLTCFSGRVDDVQD